MVSPSESWSLTSRSPAVSNASSPEASEPITADDEFVILASDGLFNVLSPEEAVKVARAELAAYDDAQMASEKLVEVALRRKTEDNITALVVRLFAPRPEESIANHLRRQNGARVNRPSSFVDLPTLAGFVQVVGGF